MQVHTQMQMHTQMQTQSELTSISRLDVGETLFCGLLSPLHVYVQSASVATERQAEAIWSAYKKIKMKQNKR